MNPGEYSLDDAQDVILNSDHEDRLLVACFISEGVAGVSKPYISACPKIKWIHSFILRFSD